MWGGTEDSVGGIVGSVGGIVGSVGTYCEQCGEVLWAVWGGT